ncbi:MAG TPA: sialidase family protein, partial [Ignavibacteria bacterium]|nr:sialidase family protein [Ignavibacteria bacterium]
MLRISIASLCAIMFILIFSGTNNERDKRRIISDHNYINGDVIGTKHNPIITGPIVNWDGPERTTFQSDNSASITVTTFEIDPTKRTIYDYQSNGMVHHLVQDPNNSSSLFAVFMTSMETASYGDRATRVFQSTDAGNTWIYLSDCPIGVRSGFPSIDVLSDGSELVATHTTDGGSILISQVYADVAPGAGSFTRLSPAIINASDNPVWPKICATSNVTNTRKFVIIASELTNDSTYTNTGTSLTTSNYSGWQLHTDIINAEAYSIARASNGKIGIVYEGDADH